MKTGKGAWSPIDEVDLKSIFDPDAQILLTSLQQFSNKIETVEIKFFQPDGGGEAAANFGFVKVKFPFGEEKDEWSVYLDEINDRIKDLEIVTLVPGGGEMANKATPVLMQFLKFDADGAKVPPGWDPLDGFDDPKDPGTGGGVSDMKSWLDIDDLLSFKVEIARTDQEKALFEALGRIDDVLGIDIEVHPIGLLLPAVQKVREAASRPGDAGFMKFDTVEGESLTQEQMKGISDLIASFPELKIEVLNPGGALGNKSSPDLLLSYKLDGAPDRPDSSAWDSKIGDSDVPVDIVADDFLF